MNKHFYEELEKIANAVMGYGMGARPPSQMMNPITPQSSAAPAMPNPKAGVVSGMQVPRPMEQGGVVKKPTLAVLGEKNKKEVVVPLENKERAKKMIKEIIDHYKGNGDTDLTDYILDTLSVSKQD